MIYLASPYTHQDRGIMHFRFDRACEAVAQLCQQGEVPYSPIVHFHLVSIRHRLPGDFPYWERANLHMLARAEQMLVLQLDGWEQSVGVAAEIKYAEEANIPVGVFLWQR